MQLLITQPKYFEFNAVVENDFFAANLHKDNFVFCKFANRRKDDVFVAYYQIRA